MTVHQFELTTLEFKRNPFPTWKRMREIGPLYRAKIPLVGKVWVFTSYEEVSRMLRNDELFVRDPRNAGRKYVVGFLGVMPRSVKVLANNMLSYDGEEHRRLRGIVDKAFQFRSVEEMRLNIEKMTNNLIDRFEGQLHKGETVDLIEHFARQLPLAVISELLGLPESDRDNFQNWGLRLSSVKSMRGFFRIFPGLWKIRNYIAQQIQACRKQPREGLLSALVHTEHQGEKLNDDELLAMGFLLLLAGHETTVHLISTAIATLFQHPDQFSLLQNDWSLAGSMVDEVMRYVSPAEISKPRMLSKDVTMHGHQLKRGEYAVAMLGTANHDPAKFENPDKFDISRHPNLHLAFGTGIHVCLGMKLAKTETEVAVQSLFERFPNLQLATSEEQLEWSQRIGFRSLNSLPVKSV